MPERGDEKTRDEREAQDHRSPGQDGAGAFFLQKRAGERRADGVGGHGKRERPAQKAPAPAELLEQGNLKDAEGKPRDDVKRQRGEREPDDEPAVVEFRFFSGAALRERSHSLPCSGEPRDLRRVYTKPALREKRELNSPKNTSPSESGCPRCPQGSGRIPRPGCPPRESRAPGIPPVCTNRGVSILLSRA